MVTFKRPEDTNGLVAALKSIIRYVQRKIADTEIAQEIEKLLPDGD